jgi:2-succinyl-5-enolpyruvyl-6-hydroxy-3-cyclohexene-1-carboxylate synthase
VVAEAVVGHGPVHLNLPFRDPLVGTPGPLPPGRADGAPWHDTPTAAFGTNPPHRGRVQVPKRGSGRGVVVAGRGADRFGDVIGWAKERGWPVLADPLSGCRVPDDHVIARFDPLLRCEPFAAAVTPDVVVRVGAPPASRVLARWLASLPPETVHVQVAPPGTWPDPERTASHVAVGALPDVATATGPGWWDRWRRADDAAEAALAATLTDRVTEPGVARALVDALPDRTSLVVSSSMPIRDVEWYARPRTGVVVHANRGANGIDGIVSTALGVAAGSGTPTAAILGDLALLHDAGGLLWAADRGVDCTLVVVDNDGGGIFSFLPQADLPDTFERLFGTPHGVDLRHLAALHRVEVVEAATVDDIAAAAASTGAESGVRLVLAPVPDRQTNVEIHRALDAAVAAAVAATC